MSKLLINPKYIPHDWATQCTICGVLQQDYRTSDMPVMDHNVVPVYKMGITGRNVTVAVVDDGVEHGHPDLEGNFVSPPKPTSCPFTLSLDLEVQYNAYFNIINFN